MNREELIKFADTVLKIGVNLQKGQGLEIACPVEKPEVARVITERAYKMGASNVHVRWEDDEISRLNYTNGDIEELTSIPKWLVLSKEFLIEKNYCYVAIAAEDPSAFSTVPAEKLAKIFSARSKALKKFSDCVMKNGIRWCVVSVPTKNWADKVFDGKENSEELLYDAIRKSMYLDTFDPVATWKEHVKKLDERAKFLNKKNFEYLRFKSKNGTDLKVGLCNNHVWLSAKEKAADGVPFIANMPTEEVFTAPHKDKIDGVVKSALPLSDNGQIIDEFSITFKKGKIVDYSAKKGYDALKRIIETDKGTLSLGEVALIGKNSPIAKSGILFYNTLFDENASCHLALGKGYPTTVKNGDKLSMSELKKLGLNDSVEHVDFMIGTPDLQVYGIEKNGKETKLFSDGEWII